jgi:hypothetical protein
MGPNSCSHPSFEKPRKIIGFSSKSSEIPEGKKYPDWCPCASHSSAEHGRDKDNPDLKFALFDLKQPPCQDLAEAAKNIDEIMYTLNEGTLHQQERDVLMKKCDALGKWIRSRPVSTEPAAVARVRESTGRRERRDR